MSLTSYRAAPPRVTIPIVQHNLVPAMPDAKRAAEISTARLRSSKEEISIELFFHHTLADLATTYSPAS